MTPEDIKKRFTTYDFGSLRCFDLTGTVDEMDEILEALEWKEEYSIEYINDLRSMKPELEKYITENKKLIEKARVYKENFNLANTWRNEHLEDANTLDEVKKLLKSWNEGNTNINSFDQDLNKLLEQKP